MARLAALFKVALYNVGLEAGQRLLAVRRQAIKLELFRRQRPQRHLRSELAPQLVVQRFVGQAQLEDDLVVVRRMEHRQVRGVQPARAAEQGHAVLAEGGGKPQPA
ncbi:hypothetical protein LP420_13825 [Massilia sp. B-10]|nr:hypothetical protein LP420_13825 [Massilia sp. B-10]